MSIAFRPKRPIPAPVRPAVEPVPVPTPAPASRRPSYRFAEAPDRGYQAREAPEICRGRHAEAPDAGEARRSSDSDSHRGRSRS